MKTYKSRPTTVEAIQYTGDPNPIWDAIGADNFYVPTENANPKLYVAANNAWLEIALGEWILKDEHGYYPCNHSTFMRKYEASTID